MLQGWQTHAMGTRGLWVPCVLFALTALLWLAPLRFNTPTTATAPVPAWVTDVTPIRQPDLHPDYVVGVFTYRCNDCHEIIPSPAETDRILTQHNEIVLKHGINTRCFNCHHRTNRNAFVDDFGHEISWDQPQLLCAKCHGPVYRDWQHGSHGRTNGYWDTARGPQTRRKCIECHDPHQPPFPPMKPSPAPHTLRATAKDPDACVVERDPLRLSQHVESQCADGTPEEGH